MRRSEGISLAGLIAIIVVVLVVVAGVAALGYRFYLRARERSNRATCMAHLSSLGKAIALYKNQWDNKWPWIENVRSDMTAVATGTNRQKDPYDDPKDPGERSITSLMFLLLHDGQPRELFICPSDSDAVLEPAIRYYSEDDEEEVYCWDFSSHRNVSYSWQAPVWRSEKWRSGIIDDDPDVVIVADKTPLYDDPGWQPDDVSTASDSSVLQRNMSQNHGGQVIHALRVAMNVTRTERPDVGGRRQDNIYTASNDRRRGSRRATSLKAAEHLSPLDSFLVGPVRGTGARTGGK